jgi:pullulanase/glycogen debranching enzyme
VCFRNLWIVETGPQPVPLNDPGIKALRERQRRNFLATLLVSQGVPMLLAGDELGHTQHGNNNTYCQDNEITWLDWDLDQEEQRFLDFVKKLVQLRKEYPVLHRRSFFRRRSLRGGGIRDVTFFEPSGQDMSDEAWNTGFVRCLGVRWAGNLINELDERGKVITGDTLLILLNAHHEMIPFTLPPHEPDAYWDLVIQTADVTQQEMQLGEEAKRRVVGAFVPPPEAEATATKVTESKLQAIVAAGDGRAVASLVTAQLLLRGGQQFRLEGRSLAILRVRKLLTEE